MIPINPSRTPLSMTSLQSKPYPNALTTERTAQMGYNHIDPIRPHLTPSFQELAAKLNLSPPAVTHPPPPAYPAIPSLLNKLRRVEDGIKSALRDLPVIDPNASDVLAYQQQLDQFWNEPEPVGAHANPAHKCLTRQEWVAGKLKKQWQLSAPQQVTSGSGRNLIEQLFSSSAIDAPGLFQVHGPTTTPGRQAELSGVFVVTRSPSEGAFSSTKPVLLAIPGQGWIECTSGRDCKTRLQNIMNDTEKHDVLLRQIPAQDRDVLGHLEQALDTVTQGLWFDATPIKGHLFANRLQSMLTQQKQDIRFWASENKAHGVPVAKGLAELADVRELFPTSRSQAANHNVAAEAFSAMRVKLINAIPDVRAEARSYMRQQVKKLCGHDVDPDQIWLHTFTTAVGSRTAFSGYHHNGRPVRSQTLTELALNNFTAENHRAAPGALDQNNGFYKVDAKHIGSFDTSNELQLQASTLMNSNWSKDFYTGYKAKLDALWKDYQKDYRTILKGQFIAEARTQLRAGSENWTADNFNMVMHATTQLRGQAVARGWGYQGPNKPLTLAALEAEAPAKSGVQRFDIYGYTSDILHIRETVGETTVARHALYIPGAEPAFIGFKDSNALREWVVEQTRKPQTLNALASHFSLYDRQDGATLFGAYGVDSRLRDLSKNPFSWSRYTYNHKKELVVHNDVFTSTVEHIKQRQYADANTLIKANGELQKDLWIADISAAEEVLVPLAPLGAPLALASAFGGLTLLGLGTDKAVNGDIQPERKLGAFVALQGALDILFSAGVAPDTPLEDPFAAGMLLDGGKIAPVLPKAFQRYELPASRIRGLTPNARGVYRNAQGEFFIQTKDSTVFQIKSDFRAADNQVQLINPNNRIETGIFMEVDENSRWQRIEVKGGGSVQGKQKVPPNLLRGEPNTLGTDFAQYEVPENSRTKIVELSKGEKGLDPDFYSMEFEDVRTDFFNRRTQLLTDANSFFKEKKIYTRPSLPEVPEGARPESMIKPIYTHADGMVLGESHNSVASKKFLIDNMRTLGEEGVTTLYMEHLQSDLHQADLDLYFKTKKMPEALRKFMVKQDIGHRTDPGKVYTFVKVLEAANKEGIRIVAIDTSTSYNLDGVRYGLNRRKMMSYLANKVINNDQKIPHKWAALVGSAHVNENEGVPGVAEIQGAIGIRVKDGPKGMRGKIGLDPGETLASETLASRQSTAKADFLITLGTRPERLPAF